MDTVWKDYSLISSYFFESLLLGVSDFYSCSSIIMIHRMMRGYRFDFLPSLLFASREERAGTESSFRGSSTVTTIYPSCRSDIEAR